MLLFAGLPTAVRVGATISTFLLLFFGCYFLAERWLKNIRAPAKAIEYETALLSSLPDKSGRTGLDIPYEFGLGFFGHIVCIAGIAGAVLTASASEPHIILAGRGLVVVFLIATLAKRSRASPFFAPAVVVSRDGIQGLTCLIPWADVVDVHAGSGKYDAPLYVETARGRSSYRLGGDGREVPYEPKRVKLFPSGMWPEDVAQYLESGRGSRAEPRSRGRNSVRISAGLPALRVAMTPIGGNAVQWRVLESVSLQFSFRILD